MTMGDWLVDKGLDAPRAPRPKQAAALSLNALRRRQGQSFRCAPFGPPHVSSMAGVARLGNGKQVRGSFCGVLLAGPRCYAYIERCGGWPSTARMSAVPDAT